MSVTLLNPTGLPKVDTHHQMAVATGSRTVFLAGQVAWDADGTVVGAGDVVAQVEQCYLNVATALAEVGGSFADVVKLTIYVVDLTPDRMALFGEGLARVAAKLGALPAAPITGIGVSALASPDLLVEVEAVAVLD